MSANFFNPVTMAFDQLFQNFNLSNNFLTMSGEYNYFGPCDLDLEFDLFFEKFKLALICNF